ncbi:amino acid ABC transporter membrane protein 2, PAAT family [Sanguibacter gelidistatuariae]|uniref:Amino acid ABC transporter membrane protein 2, PAAT family n=1 Tax=Sanguibacter gelidistatuariae TaxID=1814289 RepID=A0A1G6NSR4_9MICO|nr:amino acid ABC transporter permease [Sanguibacter gelidistatuariae]SDC70661.1 amino acid ABC transporter membrane protein 2, PAAT family [Sanguibacter gelidistatuariae]
MSGSVLYDAPGPRTRRIERIGSIAFAVVLLALVAWFVVSLSRRGVLDDRWEVLTDPPKQQTASDVWRSLLVVGLGGTLKAAVVAAPLALILAFLLAILRTSRLTIVRRPAVVVIEVLRGLPVLLMMFFGLLGFGLSSFQAVVFGLTLYNAAIIAEILRAGLSALPHGQVEAGTSIGLTRGQTLRIIQLPQVVQLMLPSLISQLVVLLKDSSLGFIVGYGELLSVMKNNYSFFGDSSRLPLFVAVVAIYLVVNLTLTRLAVFTERRLSSRIATPVDDLTVVR